MISPDNNPELNSIIRAEKLELLFHQSSSAILSSLFSASVLTAILWPVQEHVLLLSWLTILILSALLRLNLFIRYKKASPQETEILAWERPYFLTLTFTTLTWGIGSIVILPLDSTIHQVAILCFMVGLSGGALSVYSAHRAMTVITMTVLLLPITTWFLIKGDILSLGLVCGTAVFYISLIRAAVKISSSHDEIFKLGHELRASKEKYQHLVEEIGQQLVIYSHNVTNGEILYVTGGIDSIFGISKEQATGQPWDSLIDWHEDSLAEGKRQSLAMISGKSDNARAELKFVHPDGNTRVIRVVAHPVFDNLGKPVSIDGIIEDITEEKNTQEKLRQAATVFDHTQDGILIADVDGTIIDVNIACCEVSGYEKDEIIGSNPSIFSSGRHPDEFYQQLWSELIESGHWQGEIWNRRKGGEIYAQRTSIDAVRNDNGEIQHYVAVFHDVSYIKEHEARLQQMAYYDLLTGLPNRLLLQDRMKLILSQILREEKKLAVCYLDLDDFKPVNDTHGHSAGDQVLTEIAARIEAAIRTVDTVARIGGDEFIILLAGYKSDTELHEILTRLLETISGPCIMPFDTVSLSASIGVARSPQDAIDTDDLIRYADQAMYVAKSKGRNQFSFYSN